MGSVLKSYDPGSGEFLGEVTVLADEQIAQVVNAAHKARRGWLDIGFAERLHTIRQAYAAAEPHVGRLAELLSREMGKDIRRSTGEVHGTVYGAPYLAEEVKDALQPVQSGSARIEYRPFGTVAVISPWNYPLAMANNLLVPALMAGNTVIWKPSEETPLIAQALFELIHTTFPAGVFQIVHGDGHQGRTLVASAVQMIAFTGSQKVGKAIMQRAAGGLKRLVMELGGNDPMIVLADADLHAAARFAVAGSFENSGQMCTSVERIYVHASVADDFEKLVVAYAGNYRVGAWDQDGVNIGPIINRRQHANIVKHIQDAVEKGGSLLLGTEHQPPPYIQPTVISGMRENMRIEQEETFGPLVCISSFNELDQAIWRANNSTYGLGAVVFGSAGVEQVADRLEAGMIGVNQGAGGGGDVPWVGAKQSGFGFHGSPDGHRQFAQLRVITASS